jgi:DNA primase
MDFMIEQTMGKTAPKELEQKVAVADKLIPLLSAIPNPIEQELYVKRTASLLGIDTDTLHDSVRSLLAKNRNKRNPAKKITAEYRSPIQERKALRNVEGLFVGMLINHPDLIAEIKEKVHLDYFSDPGLRGVVKRLFEMPGDDLNRGNLITLVPSEDSELAGQLAKYSIRDQEPVDLQGFIERLRLEYLKGEKKKLQQQVELAEKQGKDQEVSLLQEIQKLSLEVNDLQQQLASERRIIAE